MPEHLGHIRDIGSIRIGKVDGFRLRTIVEQLTVIRQHGALEANDFLDLFRLPFLPDTAAKINRLRYLALQNQRAGFLDEDRVVKAVVCIFRRTKVAGCIISINPCVFAVDMLAVPFGEVSAGERCAVIKHAAGLLNLVHIPFVAAINGSQIAAKLEHITHVFNIGCIKGRKIQLGQALAECKHCIHFLDIRCVESGEIQR